MTQPALIVHGGAGPIPSDQVEGYRLGCQRAAEEGWRILQAGGTAEDAVEAAVRLLEDDPVFDAGRGSFLNQDGIVELDAAFMEGRGLNLGAVAGVHDIANPITLSRRVMESPHAFLVGDGASRFGEAHGLTRCERDRLITARELASYQSLQRSAAQPEPSVSDTVGAIARDATGHLAAGVSTGGMPFKIPGRVGDVPCVGAGFYVDDEIGGAVSTGEGESIMRVLMASTAVDMLLAESVSQEAARIAVDYMRERTGGHAGLIILGAEGQPSYWFSTVRMAVAWIEDGEVVSMVPDLDAFLAQVGLDQEDKVTDWTTCGDSEWVSAQSDWIASPETRQEEIAILDELLLKHQEQQAAEQRAESSCPGSEHEDC